MYDEGRRMPMEEVSQIASEAGGLQTAEYQVPVLGDAAVRPPFAAGGERRRFAFSR